MPTKTKAKKSISKTIPKALLTSPVGNPKLMLLFVALFAVVGIFVIWKTFAASVNLAQGKTVTVSSIESSTLGGTNAVDGNASTRWASADGVDAQWLVVDLGASYNITDVNLNWETAAGKSYDIQTSLDGNTWATIKSVTGNSTIGILRYSGLVGTGRYVRINMTARATVWGYSLYEIEVFGAPVGVSASTTAPVQNIALNHITTASTNETTLFTPGKATDGNTSTRWSSASADNQWLLINLGKVSTISRVTLNWETAAGKNYDIQVGPTAAGPWTIIKSVLGNTTSGIKDYQNLSGSGQYVRLNLKTRTTQWGFSLYEVAVYSSSATITPTVTPAPPPAVTPPVAVTPPPATSGGGKQTRCGNTTGARVINPGNDLASAINGASSGQTILVNGGSYTFGAVSLSASNVKLCGAPGVYPKLILSNDGFFINSTGKNNTIEGFEMIGDQGGGANATGISQTSGGVGLWVWNNRIHGFGQSGLDISGDQGGGGHVDMRYNWVWNNSSRGCFNGSGISLLELSSLGDAPEADGFHNHITNNLIWHNYATQPGCYPGADGTVSDGNGIILGPNDYGYQGKSLIENNVVVDNGAQGIHVFNQFHNVTVRNNSIYHNIWSVTDSTYMADISFAGPDQSTWPTDSTIYNNAVEPRSGRNAIKTDCTNCSFHDNATGSGLFASPNVNNPASGNWSPIGAAAGKGAPWPLW